MWLRWAPVNTAVWSLGNKYGYNVERFTLKPDGTLESPLGERLNAAPLKPMSQPEFDQLSNEVPEASVVQELIYGEDAVKAYDANNPLSVLQRNREMENQFGIALLMCDLSRRVANAAGLFFEDVSVQTGKRYIYRISLAFQPKGSDFQPGVSVVGVNEEQPIPAVADLTATFADRKASLRWPVLFHRGIYSAYFIEKSFDGKTFSKISDLPYVHLSQSQETEAAFYVDSLETNYETVYYRIFGITPFAELGPVSNVVQGEGKDDLSGLLIIREGKATPPKAVHLAWEFPFEAESRIAGFVVSKSNLPAGPYHDVNQVPLPANIRNFEDETGFYNTYFVLKAVDERGQELTRSFPFLVQIEDTTPPTVPQGITGEVDEFGKVTLRWSPNSDADLLGYRIFQSNSLKEEFTEITKEILNSPTFEDSLNINVLNKKVYYSIVAVDKNYNPSDYSPHITLNRPDKIAPVPPVFKKAEVRDGKVFLEWDNADNDDAARLQLNRVEKDDRITRTIMSWTPPSFGTTFTEPFLSLGKTYRYELIIYDSAGNAGKTLSREIFYETGVRIPVHGLEVLVSRERKEVNVQWKNPSTATKCVIYRRKNDGTFTLYHTLEGNLERFVDKGVTANNIYGYKVQLIYPKGVRSLISDEVIANY